MAYRCDEISDYPDTDALPAWQEWVTSVQVASGGAVTITSQDVAAVYAAGIREGRRSPVLAGRTA
jgi:hypothetical protein